ncbi:SUN domain-containing protein 1 isoform X4 [Microcaecilia unicolor]|nr:SUN domain-containing protein 1 isoform X4 [Microcaecilia unicolor]XP_030068064.1 SUN domain-containing protein 1 isoform X4 [Microcaecilia unicolor]XP_030068065.1 SUN domain-containing protein 1 isoform X4 [Microcaecilia unicolor]
MSRRSLRLGNSTRYYSLEDAHNSSINNSSCLAESVSSAKDNLVKTAKKHRSTSKQSIAVHHTPKRNVSNSSFYSHSSYNSHVGDTSMMSTILDESLIQEQTEMGHLWGLDEDDGDMRGEDTSASQQNGAVNTAETQTTMVNGYLCNDCSMLSDRTNVLTAHSASNTASSTVYSRDRSQKHKSRGIAFYMTRSLQVVKNTAASLTSLFVQLFQMVLLKPLCEIKAHSNFCGSMNVQEFLKEDGQLTITGESLCDDCKGKKHLETHTTTHMQSSRSKRVARTFWHILSYAGCFLLQCLRSVGAAGWLMSKKVLSFLWLAIASPGKAASGAFWWLGTGWYQLVTLISLSNVFLLTRCLRKIGKFLLLFIPLLLLLLGLWYWGIEGLRSLVPIFNGTSIFTAQWMEEPASILQPDPLISDSNLPPKVIQQFDFGRIREIEKQIAVLSDQCSHHEEDYAKITLLLQRLQKQVEQMNDKSGMSSMIMNILNQHFHGVKPNETTDTMAFHQEHDLRIMKLEDLLGKLSAKSEELQIEMDLTKARIARGDDEKDQHLMNKIHQLELDLAQIKIDLLDWQSLKTSCEKVDTIYEKVDDRIKESVKMTIFGNQEELPESLLQWLSSNFVSKNSFQAVLQELELKVFKNITHYITVTKRIPSSDTMASTVTAGISGITEEEARIIVNNALKLYSQDRIGMVDFALESGGGSILSTRCSETYETKTALMSLFGIPLWYFSQSPRVVIQPDIYPGNCWAFKGSQGYLVVRLSMMIYPTAFTVEHIPKTLSPTGNITSAPKDFAVYGLEDEYQEEGRLLGQFMYNQDGEPLQTFPVTVENEDPFQIIELRVFSNWGHNEYTCLYRFRVHGKPSK